MTSERIEAALLPEIERLGTTGEVPGTLPVLIAHAGGVAAAGEGERVDRARLESTGRAAPAGLRARLAELGAEGEARQVTLANALRMRLTPAQIRQIATHPDVGRVVWGRATRVTPGA